MYKQINKLIIMGGRITRAIYKNQRTSQRLNAVQAEKSSQAIARTISLVTSSVATFLIGYLLRPHIQTPNFKLPSNGNTDADNNHGFILFIGLCFVAVMEIKYVIRRRDKYDSARTSIQSNNKLLILGCLITILMQITSWITSYQFNTILPIGYGLIWINMLNASLLIVRNTEGISNTNQSQPYNQQHYKFETITLKRSILVYLSVCLLQLGSVCSESMRVLRVEKASKTIISTLIKQGSIIQSSLQSVNGIQRLPFEYRSMVIESEHEQKMMLKISFLILIGMISCVFIAFQKKSLAYLFIYDRKRKELHQFYQQRFALSSDKEKYQQFMGRNTQQELLVKKVGQNLSLRKIVTACGIMIVTLVVIESYRRLNNQNQAIVQKVEINALQSLLLIVTVATFSYLTLKAILFMLSRSGCLKPATTSNNQNHLPVINQSQSEQCCYQLWIGKRNMLIAFTLLFVSLQFIIYLIQVLFLFDENHQTKNILNSLLLHLANTEILFVFLIFFYIRLTRYQLIQFPQTSHQSYITIILICIYFVRYLLPYQFLKTLSQITVGFTTRWLEGAAKNFLFIISKSNSAVEQGYKFEELNVQCLGPVQGFIFIAILGLILVNEQMPIRYLLKNQMPMKQKNNPSNNTHLIQSLKRQRNPNRNESHFRKAEVIIKPIRKDQHQIDNQSQTLLNKK